MMTNEAEGVGGGVKCLYNFAIIAFDYSILDCVGSVVTSHTLCLILYVHEFHEARVWCVTVQKRLSVCET